MMDTRFAVILGAAAIVAVAAFPNRAGESVAQAPPGRWVRIGEGPFALQSNPNAPRWNGPYLRKAVPRDPWDNPYKYRCCPGQHGEYDLWSEGADNAPGGEGENADVVSWTSQR